MTVFLVHGLDNAGRDITYRMARCEVPHCGRTRRDRKNDPLFDGCEWLCRDHWVMS